MMVDNNDDGDGDDDDEDNKDNVKFFLYNWIMDLGRQYDKNGVDDGNDDNNDYKNDDKDDSDMDNFIYRDT